MAQETHSFDVSVVTVTYNEKENISLFIEAMNKIFVENKLKGEVVVVDDSSPDGTSDVVLALAQKYPATKLIKRPGKMGIGSAYKTGAEAASGAVIALLDADLSHPPNVLPLMYKLAQEGKIVFGSRYLGQTKFDTDFAHHIGTWMLNSWVSCVLKTKMKDHTNGYICMSKEVFNRVLDFSVSKNVAPFDHILYGITFAGVGRRIGIPIEEIKAPYNRRQFGETKIKFFWGLRVVFGDMWYALKLRRRLK